VISQDDRSPRPDDGSARDADTSAAGVDRREAVDLSYCVVNTNGRELLAACLAAIERTHPRELTHEVIVLDNASTDGSVAMLSERFPGVSVIALDKRRGKAENDSQLLASARGRYCLLLNEDSELLPGAAAALVAALEADPRAAAAGAQLVAPDGTPQACAWRLPGVLWALAAVCGLQRLAVQSKGNRVREVGWCQSSALLVRRRAAAEIGFLDPDFFVYSDETDFQKRLRDAGWRILFVPRARCVHHDQLSTDPHAMRRRIVEFHRGRSLYMRKHHGPLTRALWRAAWTWFYCVRLLVACLRRGDDTRRWRLHAWQQLLGGRGEGLREAAAAFNRSRAAAADG